MNQKYSLMYDRWLVTNRMKWVKRSGKAEKCPFCEIAKGKKRKKFVLHETEKSIVMMNLYPYNTGHLLIFPKRHVESLNDLKKDEIEDISLLIVKSVRLLEKALKPEGFNIGMNIGEISSASVKHLHVHIVPRYKHDLGFMELFSSTKVLPEPVESTYKRLKRYINILKTK